MLHRLSTKICQCPSLQTQVFLTRLEGPTIGLTAAGLFVVNKPTVLTVSTYPG